MQPLTRDDLINVLRRTTDQGWLDALLADTDSNAVLSAIADIWARLSVASVLDCNDVLISTAPGGRPGVATATLTRAPKPQAAVFDATNATPIVITTLLPNNYVTGDIVDISLVLGNLGANGTFTITVLSPTTFSLNGSIGTGGYISGGVVQPVLPPGIIARGFSFLTDQGYTLISTQDIPVATGQATVLIPLATLRQTEGVNTVDEPTLTAQPQAAVANASNASPITITTHQPHTYATGDIVGVSGVLGNTAANGVWTITVLNGSQFTLTTSTGNGTYGGAGVVQPAPFGLLPSTCTPIVDGASDYLYALGQERGVQRQPNELTEHYRLRVRDIPDLVSPQAIGRAVQGVVDQQKLPPTLVLEPFDDGATPALKANLGLGSFVTSYCDADACDDPFSYMVSNREARAYFRVEVQTVPLSGSDIVFFCDDGFCDDPFFGYLDVPQDPRVIAGLAALWEECNRKRAGGVLFDIFVDAYTLETAPPPPFGGTDSSAAVDTPVWGLAAGKQPQPTAGKVWHFLDGWFSHITAGGELMPANVYHRVRFDYEDSTFVITDAYAGIDSQRLRFSDLVTLGPIGGRITGVSGILKSDGVHALRMFGAFRVLETDL